jgi:DNA repair protein RecN (Recombination protein N)
MLRELRIKNFAIIDDLKINFENGLNILTGETGAGKSIIVDSLSLALGSRAQSELIRSGEKEALVQAYFELNDTYEFPNVGIEKTDSIILRRSISTTGKSRAYINDTIVNLQTLSELGKSLVDIHGQHEHQSLLSVDKQKLFIDSYGKLLNDRDRVESLYREVQALKQEEADLRQKAKERVQRIDLLRFQIQEIDASVLKAGEKEELIEEKTILSNLSRLNELIETAYSQIYDSEDSCIEKLSSTISKVKEMASLDSSVSNILETLEAAQPLIEDGALSIRTCRNKYHYEPGRLDEIEERLELIKRLERKYGEGIETIIRYRDESGKELKSMELIDERHESIEAELKVKEEELLQAACDLGEKRKKIARKIEKLVKNELSELALNNAEFVVDIQQEENVSPHGLEKIEFLFSANPGEPPRPLAKIASGGELSRVMLALKSILADFDSIPVLIFDEVDTGIGGKTAESVGRKLKIISDKHQVLCTTHLPQIAVRGDFHLKIEKGRRDERVYVKVLELNDEEKLHEIARMLGGKITNVSLKHAKELFNRVT